MTYLDMIEELTSIGEIIEDENIILVDYNNFPVCKDLMIEAIIGVYHNKNTATIVVITES